MRSDLTTTWLVTLYYSVMHAAADEVAAGLLAADEVSDLIEATLGRLLRPLPAGADISGSGSA